ncbi:DNA (cytosine-5)-methyltransferase 3-like [Choloepus didactylus]|uniref:DNA (cytosine-5)-methyltransferase 3-like n=1 Tax=Choloepus didactylus TaxID=27675 RepID=UPI0018A070D0|nr:DNA (cytosine-5)-methyltransferase 3-like [Choloepus didactylus]
MVYPYHFISDTPRMWTLATWLSPTEPPAPPPPPPPHSLLRAPPPAAGRSPPPSALQPSPDLPRRLPSAHSGGPRSFGAHRVRLAPWGAVQVSMALICPRTPTLEARESADPDAAGRGDPEQWGLPTEIREAPSPPPVPSLPLGSNPGTVPTGPWSHPPPGHPQGDPRGSLSPHGGSRVDRAGRVRAPGQWPMASSPGMCVACRLAWCPGVSCMATILACGPLTPVLDEELSMDVILVGSSEPLPTASPWPSRERIAYEVRVNRQDIEDICICCGSCQVWTQHPLFEGGMCTPCKDKFLSSLFLYDDDGYQSYCSICCSGQTLLICENPDCTRCYCCDCVDTLVGPGTSGKLQAMSNWVCFLCLPLPGHGLLRRRRKWRGRLKAFQDREAESPLEMYKTVPAWKREPVRVLSLFGDIKKELLSLGFLESGSGQERLRHLEDVTDVVRRDVEEWGPFDLLYGATPPLGHPCEHPPGWYVFQFHRLLQYARPRPGSGQPFFWMFVDNLVLTAEDRAVASRFLETDPVTIQDARGRAVQDAVRVWSNLPAVKSRDSALAPEDELSLRAWDRQRAKLPAQGPAALVKNCFLPLREYFKYFSMELTSSL